MEREISNTEKVKVSSDALNLMQVIGIIFVFFITVIGISFVNEKQNFHFYPWYYEYLVYFSTFFLIVLIYKPSRSHLIQILSALKFNRSK
ncbi:hypothetical protein V7652_27285, partial [Bacillus thuringiensis]